ncbi:MAG: hypothetical protein E6234_09045 [Sutterella wadsworthensis]|nr:hypothetical protein [Sutterella wadsworthensis]
MPNDRKEPVIDKDVYTLEDRVKLTWRDVRDLSVEEPTLASMTPAPTPAAPVAPTPAAKAPAATSSPSVTAHSAPKIDTHATPLTVPNTAASIVAARQGLFSEEEKAALVKRLSIEVEASVRQAISETIELSLTNAMARVRTDVDRSLSKIVADAITRELNQLEQTK